MKLAPATKLKPHTELWNDTEAHNSRDQLPATGTNTSRKV